MKIEILPTAMIQVTMTPVEFIGLFRTIGETNHPERMGTPGVDGSPRLTYAESIAVSNCYTVAGTNPILGSTIMEERK